MPVYEYCCNACEIQFEPRQKFSDPPAEKCPKYGGNVRKLVSATSFSLNGTVMATAQKQNLLNQKAIQLQEKGFCGSCINRLSFGLGRDYRITFSSSIRSNSNGNEEHGG